MENGSLDKVGLSLWLFISALASVGLGWGAPVITLAWLDNRREQAGLEPPLPATCGLAAPVAEVPLLGGGAAAASPAPPEAV